jgi:hypothetical protein
MDPQDEMLVIVPPLGVRLRSLIYVLTLVGVSLVLAHSVRNTLAGHQNWALLAVALAPVGFWAWQVYHSAWPNLFSVRLVSRREGLELNRGAFPFVRRNFTPWQHVEAMRTDHDVSIQYKSGRSSRTWSCGEGYGRASLDKLVAELHAVARVHHPDFQIEDVRGGSVIVGKRDLMKAWWKG